MVSEDTVYSLLVLLLNRFLIASSCGATGNQVNRDYLKLRTGKQWLLSSEPAPTPQAYHTRLRVEEQCCQVTILGLMPTTKRDEVATIVGAILAGAHNALLQGTLLQGQHVWWGVLPTGAKMLLNLQATNS
jgi:hypothetical protein